VAAPAQVIRASAWFLGHVEHLVHPHAAAAVDRSEFLGGDDIQA
jgi:hypothetical protein